MAAANVAGVVEAFFTYAVYAFVKKVAPAELYTPSRATSKEASKMALGFKYFYYLIGAMIVLSRIRIIEWLTTGIDGYDRLEA